MKTNSAGWKVDNRRFGASWRQFLRATVTWSALLLAGAISAQKLQIAPLSPDFIDYQAKSGAGTRGPMTDGDHAFGWLPAPVSVTHLAGKVTPQFASPAGLPSAYDLRTLSRVTSVKDQNPWGTCWSFGTYGSMESSLLTNRSCDFSEKNVVNRHGFDWGYDYGGNGYISMAYLARWDGPVNEADDPYPSGTWSNSPEGLMVRKHVQQVRIIPGRSSDTDNNALKQAVVDYGGICVTYYHNDAYYNSIYKTYCYTGSGAANHAVTLVGWDDNFDRTKFTSSPAGNGAFIVKNSWGAFWGQSGYFYVSYYDSRFARSDNFVFYNAESPYNYARNYQYDPLGWVSSLGAGSDTFWAANIFSAVASEPLGAVGFFASVMNTAYRIEIYTGVTAGAPTSGTLISTKTGTCAWPGYCTVSLSPTVALLNGQLFSIVLRLTTPGNNYPQPFEYAYPGFSSAASASPGQSFYSMNGTAWYDLTTFDSSANFCIKGFTMGPPLTPPLVQWIRLTNGIATLAWSAQSNHTYRVQYRTNLNDDAGWQNLVPDVVAAGPTASKTDSSPVNQRFYRVQIIE